ncbi:MAG: PEP-CTERM sorting domain-containing protein [Verrucomicrobiales bacterium]|nr:PEP-CTERM sorting domain-containing protein [Verrucomicrobiales bacterium]
MKSFALTCFFALAAIASHAQGSLTYQTTLGVGKEKYIFRCDPSLPFGSLYPGIKLEGAGFTAELWYAMGEGAAESSLTAVPGSQVGFRTGSTAGLINGKSKLDIAGTYGGDKVTLQLRVWNNEGGSVTTWDKAFEKGLSNLFTHELSGVDASGSPKLGTGSIANGLGFFVICVPEPSVVALGLLGLGSVLMARRRS